MNEPKTTHLVRIQKDEDNWIEFNHTEWIDDTGNHELLSVSQHDGSDWLKSFSFDNAHEAETFFRRCLFETRKFLS